MIITPRNVIMTIEVAVEVEVTMAQAEDLEKDRQEATKAAVPNKGTLEKEDPTEIRTLEKENPTEMGTLEGSERKLNFLLMLLQCPMILLSLCQLRYCQKLHSPIVRLTLFVTNREMNGQLRLKMFTSLSHTNLIRA